MFFMGGPLLACYFRATVSQKEYFYIKIWLLLSLIYVFYALSSILINSNTFDLSINGPYVEFLTPFLIISSPFIYLSIRGADHTTRVKSLKYYLYILVTILFVDIIARYLNRPECFMNYYLCRIDAKQAGFFTNTNVIGTFLLYLMFALSYFQMRKIKAFFVIVLFTAMARAALVTLVLTKLFYYISIASLKVKLIAMLCFIGLISYVFIVNPFDILNDGSMLSKFKFLEAAVLSANAASLQELMFGFGASFDRITDVVGVEGYSPHSSYLKAYFYFGMIGVIFFILINLYFLTLDMKFFFFILMASIINGIAGAPIYNPTIWVAFFIFCIYQDLQMKQKQQRNSCQ